MKKFYSISQYPGKTGKYFYTKFFEYYNFDAIYSPLGTNNFFTTYKNLIENGAHGISVSMPFKKEVIKYLNSFDDDVSKYNTCNTITINNFNCHGHNADLGGVIRVCELFDTLENISILGNGCMANMFAKYLLEYNISLYSNSLNNWNKRHSENKIIINCTALGTSDVSSPLDFIPKNTRLVIDLAIKDNNLKKLCIEKKIKYVSGIEFYKFQFLKQFKIYTDIIPDTEFFDFCYNIM